MADSDRREMFAVFFGANMRGFADEVVAMRYAKTYGVRLRKVTVEVHALVPPLTADQLERAEEKTACAENPSPESAATAAAPKITPA